MRKAIRSLVVSTVAIALVVFTVMPASPPVADLRTPGGVTLSDTCGFGLALGFALLGGGVTAGAGAMVLLFSVITCGGALGERAGRG